MFAVIRHYHFNSNDGAEIDRRIREEFVPIVKKAKGRTIWITDAHRGDGKRFVVRANEKLTAFLELESVVRFRNSPRRSRNPA